MLTREMLSQSRIIAKGNRIRDVQRLVESYGGRRVGWIKKSSPPVTENGVIYEYHWYGHHGLGRFEVRRKRVDEG